MAKHNDTGKAGEAIAAEFLAANGYDILALNWRHKRLEVDVIAEKNSILHFIEVKTRENSNTGFPEEKVSRKKFECLVKAADEYLLQHPGYTKLQYDIVSIISEPTEIKLIEDVFYI